MSAPASRHFRQMRPEPPLLDMTPDGRIREPARPTLPWRVKLGAGAAIAAVVAGFAAIGAILLYLLSILIPAALIAGLVAYAAFRLNTGRKPRGPTPPARFGA